ncbi:MULTISPECIES: endonuclease V [Actinokineospora]|uniref:Endonuclease V n=1 Tax=Actinokineospora fastidiosa TaxID=1816 RepID=A0A918L7B7_9PSEU|nr:MULTISPECIES: endonuclease V [Actinokineospora]UVS76662.1 Endonuclease V [Actinokineospora sp. UTMC 2448]GGS16630.1 endonuclease V [Actinokineospora fastidiosa]
MPDTAEDAIADQLRLAPSVLREPPPGFAPRVAAGLDVAYLGETGRLVAAAACVDVETGELVDAAVVAGHTDFPYVPGLFAYRELPSLRAALSALTTTPDVLVCDGQGLAHPRRFGLACHAGVVTGLPAIGVGKTPMGRYDPPAPARGSWTPLIDDGEEVGRALRTQDGVKPVFVSIGHRMDIDTATALVLRLCRGYRQPETTRAADRLCRQALRDLR